MDKGPDVNQIIPYVASEFGLGSVSSIEELTVGKVNHTYKVRAELNRQEQDYIFQNVNTYVFRKPREVMENIRRITEHIERYSPEVNCLHYRTTSAGSTFFDMISSFWRVYRYIDSVTYNSSKDPVVVNNAGRAFGQFQRSLRNFHSSYLHYTIPDFHNTTKRYQNLEKDYREDRLSIASNCKEEAEYILSMKEKALVLDKLAAEGKIPVRVTHNDTKINNVLFDPKTGDALCVVDLDTVMPGFAGHDFGDAVRSCSNSMGSASLEFDKVRIDLDIYRAFASGFLEKTGDILTEAEKDSLAQSCLVITLELASRYIDDYLTGNRYFKTNYPTQNLDRARNLIALAKDMDSRMDEMKAIVKGLSD